MSSTEHERMETRARICQRQGYECICGATVHPSMCQLAHRIPQRKHLLKKYGAKVLHHDDNLVAVCSLECNSRESIGAQPVAIGRLVDEIREKLSAGGD